MEDPMSALQHGGDVFAVARRQGVPVSHILDFSANINPLGPSPRALRKLRRDVDLVRYYPDGRQNELRNLVAKKEAIDPNCVLFGNGATQLLHLIPRFLKPRKTLVIEPGFAEYAAALAATDCKIHRLYLAPETHFHLERTPLFRAIRKERPDLIVLGNPNNPTGAAISAAVLSELRDCCEKKRIHLVLDESFIDFTAQPSLLAETSRTPYLLVVRSLTKFWALPGLRIGYLVGQNSLVKKLFAQMEPWSVNTLALVAAAESLRDCEYFRKTLLFVSKERAFLFERLAALGWLRPHSSEANFLLVRIAAKGLSSTDLQRKLERRNILIRDASSFPGLGRQYIRIAVRTRRDNMRLVEELSSIGVRYNVCTK
jgi:threonine-phosphate decarboxylase